ncbi:MAG TPA: choice-of-anchor D domain-containing protein, partial [Rubricoccaceae bacterium]
MAVATLAPTAGAQSRLRGTPPVPADKPADLGGIVADGSFEGGSPNSAWTEASSNFGTPLCTAAACGVGGGTGPHTGTWWAYFGGTNAAETGSIQQTVTIPTGNATLTYWLEIPVAAIPGTVNVKMDGTTLATYTQADQATYDSYVQVSIPINAYADGGSHVLRFEQSNGPGATTADIFNAFIDDVEIVSTPTGPSLSVTPGTVNFGAVTVGQTAAAQTVTLTNNGTTTVTVSSITFSGNNGLTATIPTTPLTLAVGATATVTLNFTPTATTPASGSLTITSSASATPVTVMVTGAGTNTMSFCSGTPISIPDGPASPYPATITVSGVNGTIADLNVRLVGLSHTFPGDIDMFLAGPTGAKSFVMSDVGTGTDISAVNLTFDDEATAPLGTGAIVAGTYQPSNPGTGTDPFPAPAPAPPAAGAPSLAVFDGTEANGVYSLYIVDDAGVDTGSLTDFCVDISTTAVAGENGAGSARTSLTASPNPIQSASRIRLSVEEAQDVTVIVYDVTGRQVATLFQGAVSAD